LKHISLLLHLYQPPTQDPALVEEIDAECYGPVSSLLLSTGARVMVNINYSLTEQLARTGSPTLSRLAGCGNVEFTGSGAWHPIYPLIPEPEMERQTALNNEGNRMELGWKSDPEGFFPPEMALSRKVLQVLRRLGFSWTVTDDLPFLTAGGSAPGDWIPACEGIPVFLRSNMWSNRIAFHGDDGARFARDIPAGLSEWLGPEADGYLLVALDGETFGHHRKGGVEEFLAPFLEGVTTSAGARLSSPSDLLGLFPQREVAIPDGSWSTTPADSAAGKPWPLWDDPGVPDHAALRALRDEVLGWARACGCDGVALLADRMLYSCPFWWAAPGRRSDIEVRRGISSMLETAFAALSCTGDRKRMDRVMTLAGSVPAMTGRDGCSNA